MNLVWNVICMHRKMSCEVILQSGFCVGVIDSVNCSPTAFELIRRLFRKKACFRNRIVFWSKLVRRIRIICGFDWGWICGDITFFERLINPVNNIDELVSRFSFIWYHLDQRLDAHINLFSTRWSKHCSEKRVSRNFVRKIDFFFIIFQVDTYFFSRKLLMCVRLLF